MHVLEAIHNRRSIRKFKDNKNVDKETILKLLQAGTTAPSAMNQQPWKFIVVQNKEIQEKISDIHKYASMVKYAAGVIVVLGDKSKFKMEQYFQQDLAACTQNVLLAATGLGLGAVWCGVYPNMENLSELKELLNINENLIPFSLIPFGYTENQQLPQERFSDELVNWIN